MRENQTYKPTILDVLENAKEPLAVETIRVEAHIGNWQTTLKHLLELKLDGLIEGIKTSKSWIFWLKNSANGEVSDLE